MTAPQAPRLDVLKALGDNTRYAIYLELVRSPRPLSTAEVAEALGLHPNTIRPHLDRMREVGLLCVEIDARGTVGRPQHRYSVASDAPSLGLEPPTFPVLARMLTRLASTAGLGGDDAVDAGRAEGLSQAGSVEATSCVQALVEQLERLGFDPAVATEGTDTVVAFTHCPFRELAQTDPELVCGLHRGLVEGFVGGVGGGRVVSFHAVTDRNPCQVELALETAG